MQAAKWVVGDECDEVLFARLKRALKDLQYVVEEKWSGLAGSQDIQHWTLLGPGEQLKMENETYVGLSVEGQPSLIAELKAQFQKNL
jgi:hypothetical protein